MRYHLQSLTTRKRFAGSDQPRAASFADLMNAIRPGLERAGVTRIANITGLDRTGVPVTLAIRPNSKTLATASGKGLTIDAAIASGAMEALELHAAEEAELQTISGSFESLSRTVPTVDPRELPRKAHCRFLPDVSENWTAAWDILSNEEVLVPTQAVLLRPLGRDKHAFHSMYAAPMDSNGLASGYTLAEAIASGLLEVIERDSITCHLVAHERIGQAFRSANHLIRHFESVSRLVDSLQRNGFEVQVFDCSTDTGVPTFKCLIYDRTDEFFPPGGGYGSSLDPSVAMQRAILEAAQGRAVVIAGARDDVFSYDIEQASRSRRRIPTLTENNGTSFISSQATDCFGEDIALICEKLKGIGIQRIAVVALPVDFLGISVVKVIIPKLEGYKTSNYIATQRAIDFSSGQAIGSAQPVAHLHLPAGGAA